MYKGSLECSYLLVYNTFKVHLYCENGKVQWRTSDDKNSVCIC